MKFILAGALALALGTAHTASAQSLEELNIQIHGYATQGFLYTTNNNIFTSTSSNGSPEWTEAVLNVTSKPTDKLRISVQGRYFVLGNFGNTITVDYAMADYKANDHFGIRFGKVKTPTGLFNEIQDIDPSYLWSLLPQSAYPISSRNSLLSHYGGVVYGSHSLGKDGGKLEYRAFGGERVLPSTDGYFLAQAEMGIVQPNGIHFVMAGGALRWRTPLPGLMFGSSYIFDQGTTSPMIVGGLYPGSFQLRTIAVPSYFGQYEKKKLMLAAEWGRLPVQGTIAITGLPNQPVDLDQRNWYGMASYKVTEKFSAGLYFSESTDHKMPLGPARFQKDWAVSGRYDFTQFLYAKAEQHFIDGTALGYDTNMNPGGLKPNTRLTILKIGVSF